MSSNFAPLPLDTHDLVADGVLHYPGGVMQGAEYQVRLPLVVLDHALFEGFVDRCFFSDAKARPHVYPVRAQGKGCYEAPGIGKAAGGQHGDLHLVGGRGDENQPRNVVFPWVPSALKAVDGDGIHAHALSGKGVTHHGALMNHLDTVLLEVIHVFLRLVAGGFDDLYAALDDGVPVLRVGGGLMAGRIVKFTPKGLSVISRVRAISLARSSGVGWVSAVKKPSPPALATGATISA